MNTLALMLMSVLATAPASAAPGAQLQLTLDDAVHMALANDEALRIEREAVSAATASVSSARGAYDQVLQLEGSWQQAKQPLNSAFLGPSALMPQTWSSGLSLGVRQALPTGGSLSLTAKGDRETSENNFALLSPSYGTQVGVELRHPLLRDLAIDANRLSIRTASSDQERARASLRRSQAETIAGTERAYWILVAARLDVTVQEEAVRLAEEQLQQTRLRTETGTASRTELAQPTAELERRRGELLAARETALRAQNALKLLVLADDDRDGWSAVIAPTESLQVDRGTVDVASALDRALARRPELAEAAALVGRRHAETRYASNATRPKLDALVAYDRYGLAGSGASLNGVSPFAGRFDESWQSLRDGDFYAARFGVVLELPLRNQTAEGDKLTAQHVERQAQAELTRARKGVRAEVLDAAAALETAGQRIDAARAAREAAETQLAAEKDRYATGLSTNFLVLTRQNDLSRARLDEISALTDYRMARTEMARATGSLAAERGDTHTQP